MKKNKKSLYIVIGLVSTLLMQCAPSMNSMRTARVMGLNENGENDSSISLSAGALSILPESSYYYIPVPTNLMVNYNTAVIPHVLEVGVVGELSLGVGIGVNMKFSLFQNNSSAMALFLEAKYLMVYPGTIGGGGIITAALPMTFSPSSSVNITLAPRFQLKIQDPSSYDYTYSNGLMSFYSVGAVLTFEIGRNVGFIPEVGYSANFDPNFIYTYPYIHIGFGIRFGGLSAQRKPPSK